jgi:RNA polymerase sigma factor (TIGR02999 family)
MLVDRIALGRLDVCVLKCVKTFPWRFQFCRRGHNFRVRVREDCDVEDRSPDCARSLERICWVAVTSVTRLLDAAAAGDGRAAADLLPLVYDELRKLAAARMADERHGHTLDATALVHEAYLRLVGDQRFDGRGHFFTAAAEAMRRVLVNRARDRRRQKRGGGRVRLELLDQTSFLGEDLDLVLSLDELLTRLVAEDPSAARIAQLHLFGGLSVEEAGEVAGVSRPVAYRNWKYVRAWLREALEH